MRRVLVTGSRLWVNRSAVWQALRDQYGISPSGITVVHGGANGADDIADRWAWGMKQDGYNVTPELHRADWDRFGRRAGHIRNYQMVKLGADVCLAFPYGESRGTRGCMKMAHRAGIPVIDLGTPSVP